MDENTMKLVEKCLAMQAELTDLRALKKALLNFLWEAELKDAKDFERYGGKYSESVDTTRVNASDIRAIFGIMPNPEALAIYKSVKESMQKNEVAENDEG